MQEHVTWLDAFLAVALPVAALLAFILMAIGALLGCRLVGLRAHGDVAGQAVDIEVDEAEVVAPDTAMLEVIEGDDLAG